jgi:hypothetical protein
MPLLACGPTGDGLAIAFLILFGAPLLLLVGVLVSIAVVVIARAPPTVWPRPPEVPYRPVLNAERPDYHPTASALGVVVKFASAAMVGLALSSLWWPSASPLALTVCAATFGLAVVKAFGDRLRA